MPKDFDDVFRVQKLADDGSNWVTYRDKMEMVLRARGLWSHVMGTAKRPDPPMTGGTGGTDAADATASGIALAAAQSVYETREEKWQMNEYLTRQYLC